MKRRKESDSSQNRISNETIKRPKLACDPCFPNSSKLGAMQKRTPCKNVDVQRDVSNFQDSIIDTYSVKLSSSPLDCVSVHSQDDPSQSYQSLDYLRKTPRRKVAGPDTEEENLYFKKDSSCSEDDLIIQALPSQPSTPCFLSRKPVFDYFKDGVKTLAACIPSSKKKKKKITSKKIKTKLQCKPTCSAKRLVDYAVSASSQSSSSSSSSSSSDEGEQNNSSSSDEELLSRRELIWTTSAEKWKVQSLPSNKSKFSSSSTTHYDTSQPKKSYPGHLLPNDSSKSEQKRRKDGVVTSPVNDLVPSHYVPANFIGYYPQANHSRFDCYNSKETVSPKSYQSQGYLRSPELCNISPRTNYNFQSSHHRSSISYYNTDEFSRDDNPRFIDSHCHLDFLFRKLRFNGSMSKYRLINQDTFPKSYEGCLAVFCDPQTFSRKNMWNFLLEDDDVWGAFGCHPKMSNGYNDSVEQHLLAALQTEKVVALGEIGLDYSAYNFSDADVQKSVFRKQLKIAVDHQLPLVIHCRNASNDTFKILKEMVPHNHRIHRHCFTGTWKEALEWLEPFPNLYIGLTPLVTFPSAKEVHETAQNIPLNRLLLETDAPYFMPKILQVPGEKRCSHPGMAIHVAAQVAAMRFMISLNDVLLATRENTEKMYGI